MKKYILTEIDGAWTIEEMLVSSIFPIISKQDSIEMISRLMQTLDIKVPVFPQEFPEDVDLGEL